jgi:uncharacterized membrane protein YhhN
MKISKSIIPFVAVFAVHLVSILCKWESAIFYTKPLLLLSLIAYCFGNVKFNLIIFAALLFSLLGDVLLLFQESNPLFFIFGLVAFLVAHICYIVYFIKIKKQDGYTKWSVFIILPTLAYGITLVCFLYPKLGEMKLPVIVYATTICAMLIAALHIKVNIFFAIGAILFVISDSLLAVNKFYLPFASASFLIMLTYGLAQALIVTGIVKQKL